MKLRFLASAAAGLTLAAIAATSVATAQAKQQGKAADNTAALNAVRAALDKYKDPIAAVRDGYYSTVGCVDFPKGGTEHGAMEYKPGAMGVHFINMGLVGPKLDSTKPQVLLYEPVGDKLVLTGAEWFVPTEVSKTPPTDSRPSAHGANGGTRADHAGRSSIIGTSTSGSTRTIRTECSRATNSAVKCPTTGYGYTFADARQRW